MCGIAGIFNYKDSINPEYMGKMLDAIKHRGPDDSGIECFNTKNKKSNPQLNDSNLILGHVRLSIIDLSSAGHQPMANSDKSIWTVYNGEIFNYPELRKELEKLGYIFKSNTDTEVLLYMYQEFGESCLEKLRGFFAFCIFDINRNKLFLARDRLGLKPLKYYWDGKIFAFASELKALLQLPWITKEADPAAIDQFLALRYVIAPLTGVKNIKKIPPGCSLVIDLCNPEKQISVNRYWLPKFEPKTVQTYKEILRRTEELLEESIRIRMMSDVPLGIFLSGGIDSSAIVALLRKNFSGKIHTFSVGFSDKKFDERRYAKTVAELYETNHTELVVEPDLKNDLQKIVWHFDEPFADPSAIPSFYLSKAAAQYVKVILCGEGGDELFAGYKRYFIHNRNRFLDYLPHSLFNLAKNISKKLPFSIDKKHGWGKIGRILESVSGDTVKTYPLRFSGLSHRIREKLYEGSNFYKASENEWSDDMIEILHQTQAAPAMEKLMALDQITSLPEDMLAKTDLAGMAHGMEARAPFLDYVFVDWVNSIPLSLKADKTPKSLLKDILSDKLPAGILKRKKAGFTPPMAEWMRTRLKDDLKQYLFSNNSPIKEFQNDMIKNMFNMHMSEKANFGEILWLFLSLAVWLEINNIKVGDR
jgi:asparagine synthase (glutamine-hydrolysing)